MFVIFTSKSTKGAIKSTYRILDNYAIRIGANTWKTAITMDGLNSVNKELKKAASRSKNLAVSCHLIKKRTSKVIWTIGKKGIFHENGAIAVHIKKISKKDFLMKNSEDQWPYVEIIKISAGIGALLHDLGKSTKGFQKKLTTISKSGDPLRHEWISLKLFEILIKDCNTDEKWLERFKEFDTPNSYLNNFTKKTSYENLINSIPLNELKSINLNSFPPYARFIAYLIYSHHRLPGLENREWDSLYFTDKERENYKKVDYPRSKLSLESYYNNLFQAMNHWVINPYKDSEIKEFFKFTNFVTNSKAWQKEISKYTKKALNSEILYPELNKAKESLKGEKEYINIFDNPIILKLTRLCLMVGDYSFSSMPKDPKSDDNPKFLKNLKANTIFQEKTTKQYLDEHLLGVKNYAVEMAHLLPYLNTHLPRLEVEYTSSFAKKTPNENFKWQNIAFNEVQKQAKTIKKEGFFGVNIASTGSGKTVANARVMYAMSNKQDGVRFTIALGLRTLTIQTGQSIRDILDLNENELKTLVGGSYDSNSKEHSDIEKDEIKNKIFTNGSESSEELFNGFMDYNYSSYSYDTSNYNLEIFQKLFNTSNDGKKSADLLLSPILVCTIDHLMNASECKRGGKYIIPLLRILTSDLVLDEPDDFDMNDLPALTRLVHLVGMFGSNILLSSATMTTDMIAGLFKAYEAGRLIYNQMNNQPTTNIVCGLFSENQKNIEVFQCKKDEFEPKYIKYIKKHIKYLESQPIRRSAKILDLNIENSSIDEEFCINILKGAIKLHENYHENYSIDGSTTPYSIGLFRVAHINKIIQILTTTFHLDIELLFPEYEFHLNCYHSRQVFTLRNNLEKNLDRILKRSQKNSPADKDEVSKYLKDKPNKKHIFIVYATPVAEVGRDHDYDWAIVEPSSMRSIIQLAGRVWRHRPWKTIENNKENMLILQYNLNYYLSNDKSSNNLIFTKPGFQDKNIHIKNYDMKLLLPSEHLDAINSILRIMKPENEETSINTLIDIEYKSMHQLNIDSHEDHTNYINAYWKKEANSNNIHTLLQDISPFRKSDGKQTIFLVLNQNEKYKFYEYNGENIPVANDSKLNNDSDILKEFNSQGISTWLANFNIPHCSLDIDKDPFNKEFKQYEFKLTIKNSEPWFFNKFLGFYQK